MRKDIHLWGVKQNNLKNLDVKIPIGSFTVICGPSGSGKSSLAFDTLYAEGQRRFIDSLSNYAKQFLKKAPKPDIEGIENIPPAIAIEQKNTVKNSRSTVGTSSEVLDYLRLLYEKIGSAYCPDHHILLEKDEPVTAGEKVIQHLQGERGYLLCRIDEKQRLLSGKKLWQFLKSEGYARIYIPGKKSTKKTDKVRKKTTSKVVKNAEAMKQKVYSEVNLGQVINIDDLPRKNVPKEEFYLVIDRLVFNEASTTRIIDSIAQAFRASTQLNQDAIYSNALVITITGKQIILDEQHSCSVCNFTLPEISSRLFSFNNPIGACPTCNGFGNILKIDEHKVIPDPTLTIIQGAIKPFFMPSAKSDKQELMDFAKKKK